VDEVQAGEGEQLVKVKAILDAHGSALQLFASLTPKGVLENEDFAIRSRTSIVAAVSTSFSQ